MDFLLLGLCAFGGALFGSAAVIFFDRWIGRTRGSSGRSYSDRGAPSPEQQVQNADPMTGGAIGLPVERVGDEVLWMQPVGDQLRVMRRCRHRPIADVVVDEGKLADDVFAWFKDRLGTGQALLEDAVASDEPPSVVLRRIDRETELDLVLVRRGPQYKVAVLGQGKVQSVALVTDEAEGCELFDLIAGGGKRESAVAEPDDQPPQPRVTPMGGAYDQVDADSRAQIPGSDLERARQVDGHDWSQLFQ